MADIDPVHPGEILQEEFLTPLKMSQNAVAQGIGVSARRINEIIHKKRSMTADTALRLSLFFGTTPDFWLHLQLKYDLEIAKDKSLETLRNAIKPYVYEKDEPKSP